MKFFCTIFITMFLLFSCKQLDEILIFEIKNETQFTIPSAIGINTPFSIPSPDIESSSKKEFENNNTNADKVKRIVLKELSLTILSPDEQTFKFIKSIYIYISAQGLQEKKIAYRDNIPDNIAKYLELNTTDDNIADYIKKDSYDIKTEVTTDEIILHDVELKCEMYYEVTANPL